MRFAALLATTCAAQETNEDFPVAFTDFGASVHGVRFGIVVTNNLVSIGSEFVIFIRMENGSTNAIYVGESGRGGNYVVSLKRDSGTIYTLTREAIVDSYLTVLPIRAGESRYWVKLVSADKYYVPPGIRATKKSVPTGDYTLDVTRTFIPMKGAKPESLEANLLHVEIR